MLIDMLSGCCHTATAWPLAFTAICAFSALPTSSVSISTADPHAFATAAGVTVSTAPLLNARPALL